MIRRILITLLVFLLTENVAAYSITNNGGECTKIGNWDNDHRTCKLTHDVTNTIQINGDNITLDGGANKFAIDDPKDGIQIGVEIVSGSKDNTITNLKIIKAIEGIRISDSNNNIIKNVDITYPSQTYRGKIGIRLTNSNNNTIEGNTISTYEDGITIKGSKKDNKIIKNKGINGNQRGINLEDSEFGIISENELKNNIIGIRINNPKDHGSNTLVNNEISGMNDITKPTVCIFIDYSDHNIIENGKIELCNKGVYIHGSRDNTVTKVSSITNNKYGIYIGPHITQYGYGPDSSGNTVCGNVITGNSYGIYIRSKERNFICSNTITGPGKNIESSGIYLESSQQIDITSWGGGTNTIKGNKYGVNIKASNNNMITKSIIEDNKIAIRIDGSKDNYIYDNIFNNDADTEIINNQGNNRWNITLIETGNIIGGTHTGGNYWGNPSKFSDKCTDAIHPDGICDTQFDEIDIKKKDIDKYPLTKGNNDKCNYCHTIEITDCLENTPPGHYVMVSVAQDIEMMFDTVMTCGTTRSSRVYDIETIDDYKVYAIYDINTTSLHSGDIEIMISYSNLPIGSNLRLLHYEGNWVDITTYVDQFSRIITGNVNSLSLFAIVGKPQTIKGDTNLPGLIIIIIILLAIGILNIKKNNK